MSSIGLDIVGMFSLAVPAAVESWIWSAISSFFIVRLVESLSVTDSRMVWFEGRAITSVSFM